MYKTKRQISLIVLKYGKFATVVFILCKLLSGFLFPFTAYVFQNLIDEIISTFQTKDTFATLITPLLMIASIYIFQAIQEPTESYCDYLIRQRLNYWFDTQNIDKLTKIKYAYFENSEDLDLINRIDGSSGDAAVDLFENILNLISGIIKIVGTFILLLTYNFFIAIAVVLVAIPVMIISAKYGKSIHDWYHKNSKSRRRLSYLSSMFIDRTASLEIKEYNHYDYLKSKWSEQFKDLRNKDFKLQMKAWKNTILSALLLNLFEYTTYAIMLLPTVSGVITIGTFVGLSKAIANIEGIILWNFSSLFTFFSRSSEYWKDYNRFLNFTEGRTETKLQKLENNYNQNDVSIEFKNIYFRYQNMETDILSDLSFTIKSNELCGLVGINGAGKSTLSKLILGLYTPNSGDIFINGKNTKEMSFNEQVGHFGVTYQDFSRYNISILDNIGLASQNINSEKVKEVLKALCFDFEKLPYGIDTIAGLNFGNGTDISGGEWQKIAIARMLFSNTSFYIMDEPTASLDPISEVELYKQIQDTLLGKSSLLITHRLGATVLCDKIMVLDGGKIVESGTFSELLERRGIYAKMYNEQKHWYEK